MLLKIVWGPCPPWPPQFRRPWVVPILLVTTIKRSGHHMEGIICHSTGSPHMGLFLVPTKISSIVISVVDIWSRGSTCAPHTMALVCLLYFCASNNNINVCVIHVPGACNDIADSLSHFQMEKFRKLFPKANILPNHIPAWPTQTFTTTSCNAGIAKSTRQPYKSGLAKFWSFCQYSLTSVPASSQTLQYFCAREFQLVSYKTIESISSGHLPQPHRIWYA